MASSPHLAFDQADLMQGLVALDDEQLDALAFGVIGFGKEPEARVVRYNAYESAGAGLDPTRVLGRPLFGVVAQCMNNGRVARRFEEAVQAGRLLDETFEFTFTLHMRVTPVVLRLLSSPDQPIQFIVVRRSLG